MNERPEHESPDYRYNLKSTEQRNTCVANPIFGFLFGQPCDTQCNEARGHGYKGLYCKRHATKYPADC